MGPTLPVSVEIHATKYRTEGESFEQGMTRIANALKDDQPHFEAFRDVLMGMRFMPGGRVQAAMGAPKIVTPYNCFHRDTEIATYNGFVRLGDHVGATLMALSPVSATFHPAVVKTYGEQELFKITISTSSKNDPRHGTFMVRATRDHRWVLQTGEVTTALEVGHLLKAGDCAIPGSKVGFVHGFVYGDGTKQREGKFLVRVCGDKRRHLRDILDGAPNAVVTYPPSNDGDPNVTIVTEIDLKALPSNAEAAYLRGFVQGLLAADGCFKVREDEAFIFSGTETTVQWMRDHLIYAGYAPCGRAHMESDKPTNFGDRTQPLWRQLFRLVDEHKGYRVISIEADGVDTVYCVEEPDHRQIVLRNGLRSGQCFVSGTIDDSFTEGTASIMARATEAAETMRLGGGIGYDFSTLRPRGDLIRKLGSKSSGPVSFMHIFDAVCKCVASSGHRRGAQMAVMRVDHPDIMEFVNAKKNQTDLTGFNMSVAVTDEFMDHLARGRPFPLRFGGNIYREIDPVELWEMIMRNTWDWAEPGVLFIDQINRMNNLWYCETIAATNPCLVEGTLVSTEAGLVPVETVKVGDRITTVDGLRPVKTVEIHDDVAVFDVAFSDGTSLRATAAHIFHTKQAGKACKKWDNTRRLSDLKIGDKVRVAPTAMPNLSVSTKPEHISDRDFGLMIGVILGDGCYTEKTNQVKISVKYEDVDWTDFLVALFRKYGYEATISDSGTCNTICLRSNFRTMLDETLLQRNTGRNKVIPIEWINSNREFLTGLIDGLICTDGNIHASETNPMIRFSSGSAQLATGLKRVLSMFGVHARIYTKARKPSQIAGRDIRSDGLIHQLVVLGGGCRTLSEQITLSRKCRQERFYDLKINYQLTGEMWDTEIKAIRPAGKAKVYDLYEPVTDTWVTDGIVNRGCGEQPLPPHGACLLGSFNLVKYVNKSMDIDLDQLGRDIPHVVRAMDNVVDRAEYPLPQQGREARAKRRMGLGVTGLANALEADGETVYGSPEFVQQASQVMAFINHHAYLASVELAREKGAFAMLDRDHYLDGGFVKTLDKDVRKAIRKHGIRNSHLTSIAPTGTISLSADNVSSGVEPVFSYSYARTIQSFDGPATETVTDYGVRVLGVKGKRASEVEVEEHVEVLCAVQKHVDSAVSKTCNVGDHVPFDRFKEVYRKAWEKGAKGITTFRAAGKRYGILVSNDDDTEKVDEGAACRIDPVTGARSCE